MNIEPLPFDPEAALDLLEETGWTDSDSDGLLDKVIDDVKTPFKFTMLVNSGNQMRKDIALTLQAEIADVGIEMEVRELDWSVFLDEVKNQRAEAFVLGWRYSLAYYPDVMGKTGEAIEGLERARAIQEHLEPSTQHIQTYLSLSQLYVRSNKSDRAREALEAGLLYHPGNDRLTAALMQLEAH